MLTNLHLVTVFVNMEVKGNRDIYRICILLEKRFLWPNNDENGEYNVYRTIPKVTNKKPNMGGLAYPFLKDMFEIMDHSITLYME